MGLDGSEKRERESASQGPGLCAYGVCVCVCMHACVCVCVCMCVKTLLLCDKIGLAYVEGIFECIVEALTRACFGAGWAGGYCVFLSPPFVVLVIYCCITNDSKT